MTSGLPPIPEPPREPRWKPCLARRWILGLIGGQFALFGLILFVISFTTAEGSPFDDDQLDGNAWTASGSVNGVEKVKSHWFKVRYEFEFDKIRHTGASFVNTKAPSYKTGDSCTIEFLAESPDINRIRGTRRANFDPTLSTIVTVLLVLGVALLYIWLRGALRLRIALREGRLTMAQLIEYKVLRHVNPNPVRVRYRLRDALGVEHILTHCVGVKSPLGKYILANDPRELPVIHDEGDPAIGRLVHAEDFHR